MLGLSIGKVLLLAVLALVVWMFFRYRARVRIIREAFRQMQRQAEQAAQQQQQTRREPVSLKACPVCGSYVSTDAAPCGRPDCPQRR
jgi:hypothetical protein